MPFRSISILTSLCVFTVLTLPACTVAPFHGQVVHERQVDFRGFALAPAAYVVIEVLMRNPDPNHPAPGVWVAIDHTRAYVEPHSSPMPVDKPLYAWSKIVKLESPWFWRNDRARVRVRIHIDETSDSAESFGVMFDERGLACLGARLDAATVAHPLAVHSMPAACSEASNGGEIRQEVEIQYLNL